MKPNSRVLVATDLSTGADEALREGARLAAQAKGPLAVVHVLPPLDSKKVRSRDLVGRLEREIRERLRAVEAPDDTEIFIDEGPDAEQILRRAAEWRAELIVVGARAPSPLGHVLRGVGERVVRGAHCPVLVARPSHGHGGVLAATDLVKPSLPAVVAGAEEASRRGTRLRVVHAVGFLDIEARYLLGLGKTHGTEAQSDFAGLEVELSDAVARLGIDPTCLVLDGAAPRVIVDKAKTTDAELVVVATRPKTGRTRAFLRSVAEQVVRKAPCSVLVVRGNYAKVA